MKTSRKTVFALFAATAAWQSLPAQNAPAPAASSKADDEVVQLSPFEVRTTQDRGYAATETLAGTRIRTNLSDVGSAIQVITKEFMQDIGATDNSTLLQYTTNTEVAGTRGIYAGLGNATAVDEVSSLRNPQNAQRVRGLAPADNTRDFFVSDIPWDSYNVDRIDIQRGPNAILFGLGSPAGIVNASTRNAEFRNLGSAEARTGSYGTFRSSVDLNQELLPGVLAIRFDGLWDDHKYEQQQAWQNDKRFFGAVRFDPQLFNRTDFHTSIKLKFENGDISANRPRTTPPEDRITPWFRAVDRTSLQGGMGKVSVANGYTLGSSASTFDPWLGGLANQQQPVWFMDGTSNQLYRIYGGYVNTGRLDATGKAGGAGDNIVGQRYADVFSQLTSLSSYAANAHLPNYQYGQYRNSSLMDPTVFDFYDNLIDGQTASQYEKWNATNIDVSQTFWNDRVGVNFIYDRQKYERGGQNLIGNPAINIDLLQNFQDYVIGPNNASNGNVGNPNFGRPFVSSGAGSGNSYQSDRKYIRGSLFGELRASDFLAPESFLAKLLGKHRFNGVYSDEKYFTENRGWQMYANSTAYATFKTQGAPDGFSNLAPVSVIYLGSTLKDATSAANAHISPISGNLTLPDGNIYQFESTWKPQAGVVYTDPWNVPTNLQSIFNGNPVINTTTGQPYAQLTQVSNPANYVGWNSNFHDELIRYDNGNDLSLLTSAAKTMRETKSYAGSWQGFLWNDAIVPTLGWRYDEVKGKGVTAQSQGAKARNTLNISPDVYKLPDAYPVNQIFKDHSTSGGLVVHLNKLLGEHDFLPINVSLSYNKSNNFQVTDTRRDIYGSPIANPTGSTKEYGVLLSTKDGKYSLRATKYETGLTGTDTPLNASGITNSIKNALNWRNIKVYYMSLYDWSSAGQAPGDNFTGKRYQWDPSYVDANGRPVASGRATTGIPDGAHLETQEEANAHRDASIAAVNDLQKWLDAKGYFTAWNYGVGPTTPAALQTRGQYEANPILPNTASVYDYRGNPDLQGFRVTSDVQSKGYEFELTANPLPNLRLAFNASEVEATRTNVGGAKLDELVSYLDTFMAGAGGDLIMFNSEYSAANQLRQQTWTGWRGQYTLLKLQENTAVSELRKWQYRLITNYSFTNGFLKGVGVGGSYRWADKVIIGYPVIPDPVNPTLGSFDLSKPYYGPSEDALDLWLSYERKLTSKINWRIQLNVYNVGKSDGLIPISVQPDGHTWAAVRVSPVQEWMLTNTFSF